MQRRSGTGILGIMELLYVVLARLIMEHFGGCILAAYDWSIHNIANSNSSSSKLVHSHAQFCDI
jgi:hypothetical protein